MTVVQHTVLRNLEKIAEVIRHKIFSKETESLLDRVPESVFLFTAPSNLCSCLPFSVSWQSSHKITRTQHTILTHRVIQFLEPSGIRKRIQRKNTDFSTGQSPSLFSGCRHFIFGFRDTYSESLRVKRAEIGRAHV